MLIFIIIVYYTDRLHEVNEAVRGDNNLFRVNFNSINLVIIIVLFYIIIDSNYIILARETFNFVVILRNNKIS